MSATFAVLYTYGDDTELRARHLSAHVDYLRGLSSGGSLLAAGGLLSEDPSSALILLRCADAAEARALTAADPFVSTGYVVDCRVWEWTPPLGPVAAALNGRPE